MFPSLPRPENPLEVLLPGWVIPIFPMVLRDAIIADLSLSPPIKIGVVEPTTTSSPGNFKLSSDPPNQFGQHMEEFSQKIQRRHSKSQGSQSPITLTPRGGEEIWFEQKVGQKKA